jgi:hypothetical protein
MPRPLSFVIYADYAQIVLLDANVDLYALALGEPFWSTENADLELFSVRAQSTAISVGGMNKDWALVDVVVTNLEPPRDTSGWRRVADTRMHLPSGALWVTEIIDMEPPKAVVTLEPGWYGLRASLSDYDWDVTLELPAPLSCEEPVRQRVKLEWWREPISGP